MIRRLGITTLCLIALFTLIGMLASNCKKASERREKELQQSARTCKLKLIYQSGTIDTMTLKYIGYIELSSDGKLYDIRDGCTCNNKLVANSVASFTVLEQEE